MEEKKQKSGADEPEKKKKKQYHTLDPLEYPMTSMEEFYGGVIPKPGEFIMGFSSNDSGIDTQVNAGIEVPLSERGRKRSKDNTSSVHYRVELTPRIRDIVTMFIWVYRVKYPGARINMKDIVERSLEKYLKKLSPEIYKIAIDNIESAKK